MNFISQQDKNRQTRTSNGVKTILTIKGTHCASCKALIEDVCKDFNEVVSCNADYKTGRTEIEHSDGLDMQALVREIEGLGNYKVEHMQSV